MDDVPFFDMDWTQHAVLMLWDTSTTTWSKKFSTVLFPWQFVRLFPLKTSLIMFFSDILHHCLHCLQVCMSKLMVSSIPFHDWLRIVGLEKWMKRQSLSFVTPTRVFFFRSCSHWFTDLPSFNKNDGEKTETSKMRKKGAKRWQFSKLFHFCSLVRQVRMSSMPACLWSRFSCGKTTPKTVGRSSARRERKTTNKTWFC